MSNKYRHNHYVPEWYQKRFLPAEQINKELFYLDLEPRFSTDSRGISHPLNTIRTQGFKFCFAENDLYTRWFGTELSTDIEEKFFGSIDSKGNQAIDYFTELSQITPDYGAFRNMIMYMSTQKLRTPKGLAKLSTQVNTADRQELLNYMVRLRGIYCAVWSECVWQIADASNSETKFIISDHPITVYNRACGPKNKRCRKPNDPHTALQGTHTIFPLSLNKVLILTNLSWVIDPYQSATQLRPNSNPNRDALFSFKDIQIMRQLSEEEVRQINFVIKSRAFKQIAAAKKEWLFPENYVSAKDWNMFGDGYLFMPDPRSIYEGGETYIGYENGSTTGFDQYGRRPWQESFGQNNRRKVSYNTLYRFKGEFAEKFGPYRRGRSFPMMQLDNEKDSDEMHQFHLSFAKSNIRNRSS